MKMIYDIWVNWCENAKNSQEIYSFPEWKTEDQLKLIKTIPIFKVTNDFFHYVENSLTPLPIKLLKKVEYKCLIRKENFIIGVKHCFLISNGNEVLAIDTFGENYPKMKSKLTYRQEEVILKLIENLETTNFDFEKEDNNLFIEKELIGLTRKEKEKRTILITKIKEILNGNNENKILYYYSEWNNNNLILFKNLEKEKRKKIFLNELSKKWTKKHEELLTIIYKGENYQSN